MRALLFLLALAVSPLAAAQSMAIEAAPASGTLAPSGPDMDRLEIALRTPAMVPETIQADGCYGYLDASAPDAVVQWGGGDLRIQVEGDFDPTLVVARPDGEWACIDDSASGPLPILDMVDAPAGRYAVWVASFGEDPMASSATLVAGVMPPRPVLNVDAAPLAGSINAPGGFEAGEGTLELAIEAGGSDEASAVDPELYCAGYVNAAQPTATVLYSASGGTGRLAIGAVTDASMEDMTEDEMMAEFDDLVLMVVGPDGQLYCNDDYVGPDPLVVIDGPESGTYSVWAGTYSLEDDLKAATLTVAESAEDIDFGDMDFGDFDDDFSFSPYSTGSYVLLDLEAVPAVRLRGGSEMASVETSFTPDSPNPIQGDACRGFIERSATVAMELSGDGPFALRASGLDDLTLTVLTPGGMWYCSDDAEELNPGIQLDDAEDGIYRVWVGTFGDMDTTTDVTVSVGPGEVVAMSDFGGSDRVTQTEGMYSGTEVRSGSAAAELSLEGDTSRASQSVMAGGMVLNPVEGGSCQGFISERPSLSIVSSHYSLEIQAMSDTDEDLTMVVLGPDGSWTCSDDADGTNPAASVNGGEGEYSVWIGTFSRRMQMSPATVTVEMTPMPPAPPAPDVIRG